MQLRDHIESPCGLRYVFEQLELQAGYTRRWMLDMPMMRTGEEIAQSYEVLRQFVRFVEEVDTPYINTLQFRLQGLKDIRTTIKNLGQQAVLDDIELFEVKHLAILAVDVAERMKAHDLDQAIAVPDLNEVITILDPDGLKMATFYVYDSYCQELRDLRAQMRQNPSRQEELLAECAEIEEGVRRDLSKQLVPFAKALEEAQIAMAKIDMNLAKALQIKQLGLCFPTISKDDISRYEAMFHPQVKDALAQRKRAFQPVSLTFGQKPTLITGANMGGKTVVLKTLTLCQYLFQYGFGIPAQSADIAVKDEIYFCIGDEQSIEKGLSSFAAEMKNIDAVIKASRENRKIVALIDEPARTTNPTEGTAFHELDLFLVYFHDAAVGVAVTTIADNKAVGQGDDLEVVADARHGAALGDDIAEVLEQFVDGFFRHGVGVVVLNAGEFRGQTMVHHVGVELVDFVFVAKGIFVHPDVGGKFVASKVFDG